MGEEGRVHLGQQRQEEREREIGKSGHSIRGNGFGHFLDLDEAHAAVFSDGEVTMVAESRDIDASDFASLKDRHAL